MKPPSDTNSNDKAGQQAALPESNTWRNIANSIWSHEKKVWSDVSNGKGTASEYLEVAAECGIAYGVVGGVILESVTLGTIAGAETSVVSLVHLSPQKIN